MKTLSKYQSLYYYLGFGRTYTTKPDKIENQTEVSSQINLVKESLRMQNVSKIRNTTICATKTTSKLDKIILLQKFQDLFPCLSRYKQTLLLLLLRQVHLLLLLLLTFEKRFILQTVQDFPHCK